MIHHVLTELVSKMEQAEYNALYTYLSKGVAIHSSDYDANKKKILRRKAENFRTDNDELDILC